MWHDLRYAARTFRKSPGFTLVATLTLAIGIGGSSAVFSVVHAVLIEPLPYAAPERLVLVWSSEPRGLQQMGSTPPDFRELRARSTSFDSMAAFYATDFNLVAPEHAERVEGAFVSASLPAVLGVPPALGRAFLPEEEQWGNHRVVLVSDRFWRSHLGGDPSAVGRGLRLNGDSYTVVGVLPPRFDFPSPTIDLWAPIAFAPGDPMNTRGNHFLGAIARLRPGASLASARADVAKVAGQLAREFPENTHISATATWLREDMVRSARPALVVLAGAVGLLLLIGCANLANLLLARGTSRRRELALRAALGAGRWRLTRQLLTESVLLALLGGALGLLFAAWAVDFLSVLAPADLSAAHHLSVDSRVLAFAAVLSTLTGLAFGALPARAATRVDLAGALKEGAHGSGPGPASRRTRNGLVVAEVALSLMLLVGAVLLGRSFLRLRAVELGFDPQHVLAATIVLPESQYPKSQDARAFFDRLIERVAAQPGVAEVAATSRIPLGSENWGKNFSVEGHPLATQLADVGLVWFRVVSDDYFRVMRIPLRRGRLLARTDTASGERVVVINETAARRYFPGEDPVGKRIWLGPPEHLLPAAPTFPRMRVVGVVADTRGAAVTPGLAAAVQPEVFAPYVQDVEGRASFLVVRTGGDPHAIAGAVRDAVRGLDPGQPVAEIKTMRELLGSALERPRFEALLIGLFAALALLLAAVGLYGVVAYAVAQRRHEIGIRRALGAGEGDILRMVLWQGLRLVALGVGLGLLASLALSRLLTSLLFEVGATDPASFVGAAALLAGVALLANFLPARRATRVDPMIALRYE